MAKETWGDYEFESDQLLGRGGMGAVYRGRQISLDRTVAIKVLKPDLGENAEFINRFHREAKLIAQLVDPHVVQIYGAGEYDGNHFYAMEFVQGEDLSDRLKRENRFTMEDVLDLAEQVGTALKAAWKFKIVHRDIKPSNILLTSDGTIKVMDFGLAKNPETDLTQTSMIMGTAKYMAPEQVNGLPTDFRSDLYSLGCVLYEMGTGRVPFQGDHPQAILFGHLTRAPEKPSALNPAISQPFEALLLRCLEKDPEDRFRDPDHFLQSVRAIREGVSSDEKTLLMERLRPAVGLEDDETGPTVMTTSTVEKGSDLLRLVVLSFFVLVIVGGAGVDGYLILQEEGINVPGGPAAVVPAGGGGGPPSEDYRAKVNALIDGGDYEGAALLAGEHLGRDSDEWKRADREIQIRALLGDGEKALNEGEWGVAEMKLREALKLIPADDERREEAERNGALASYRVRMGAKDYEGALRVAEAKLGKDSEACKEAKRLLSVEKFEALMKRAEEVEAKRDWHRAAQLYKEAFPLGPGRRADEAEEKELFCRKLSDAQQAKAKGDWKRAIEIYQAHLGNPRGHESYLTDSLEHAERKLKEQEAAARQALQERFDHLVEETQVHFRHARWADGLAAAEKAAETGLSSDALTGLLSDLRDAVAAPEGFVYVPAGMFRMGSGADRTVTGPPHDAETGAFYILEHEVTVQDYARFLESDQARTHKGCPGGEPAGETHEPYGWSRQKDPKAPVTGVDWHDAAAFAAAAGGRLPTETEWEKAAAWDSAAAVSRTYPWGADYSKDAEDLSFFGCRGMGSGPLEWTATEFAAYEGSKARHFEFGRGRRVLRGGVRLQEDAMENLKTAFRYWNRPEGRDRKFGFRIVRDVR